MPVQSLYELSKMRLIQNIGMLDDIGDIPYDFLAPILRHIQNPQQLIELEERCPQLLGETGEIWMRYIKRDIPNWETKPHQPRNPHNYSKVYKKLLKDAEREKFEQEEALKESMRALQQDRNKNKTLIVEGRTGYDPAMKRWGFGSRGAVGGGSRGGSGWGDPAAPKKTGKVLVDKLRRGAYDQKLARPKATQMPAHLLAQRKGMVAQAPARLVRMNENAGFEAPKKMVISRSASASMVGRNSIPHPTLRKPIIRTGPAQPQAQPASQQSVSSAAPASEKKVVERPTLGGQQFLAPKLQPQGDGLRPNKRKPPPKASLFHNFKKRKI
ncbi:hypothetical protein K504DRAFT_465075 [Pleomassaria siparia CBS 279.74]|uniref:Elongin-A n=1 Tax=Pleomassaria siparia CBS 279.74 TaxID=1314801 RepID=A0A6G1KEV9_9PLEO|nr:hypothetical protein K504DRAFT_465075 [Pleomassaria siparia CBS 279.74]